MLEDGYFLLGNIVGSNLSKQYVKPLKKVLIC